MSDSRRCDATQRDATQRNVTRSMEAPVVVCRADGTSIAGANRYDSEFV
eukprot:CAMPEP_0168196086 /NCGR_PEP_ID=MMETSP0139_2-20121125/20288_1 /TAXON_ID=44445 /ORGANISM="Pseudo-nitzschia australis, Strain 10249 10 AB" /LENGTH=48 /DNA_ID= /DNA_START= /DNA_END= /DNA_ORIENTATION=